MSKILLFFLILQLSTAANWATGSLIFREQNDYAVYDSCMANDYNIYSLMGSQRDHSQVSVFKIRVDGVVLDIQEAFSKRFWSKQGDIGKIICTRNEADDIMALYLNKYSPGELLFSDNVQRQSGLWKVSYQTKDVVAADMLLIKKGDYPEDGKIQTTIVYSTRNKIYMSTRFNKSEDFEKFTEIYQNDDYFITDLSIATTFYREHGDKDAMKDFLVHIAYHTKDDVFFFRYTRSTMSLKEEPIKINTSPADSRYPISLVANDVFSKSWVYVLYYSYQGSGAGLKIRWSTYHGGEWDSEVSINSEGVPSKPASALLVQEKGKPVIVTRSHCQSGSRWKRVHYIRNCGSGKCDVGSENYAYDENWFTLFLDVKNTTLYGIAAGQSGEGRGLLIASDSLNTAKQNKKDTSLRAVYSVMKTYEKNYVNGLFIHDACVDKYGLVKTLASFQNEATLSGPKLITLDSDGDIINIEHLVYPSYTERYDYKSNKGQVICMRDAQNHIVVVFQDSYRQLYVIEEVNDKWVVTYKDSYLHDSDIGVSTDDGRPFLVFLNMTGIFTAEKISNLEFAPPRLVKSDPQENILQVAAGGTKKNNVPVWHVIYYEKSNIYYVNSINKGRQWSNPRTLNDNEVTGDRRINLNTDTGVSLDHVFVTYYIKNYSRNVRWSTDSGDTWGYVEHVHNARVSNIEPDRVVLMKRKNEIILACRVAVGYTKSVLTKNNEMRTYEYQDDTFDFYDGCLFSNEVKEIVQAIGGKRMTPRIVFKDNLNI